MTDVFQGYFTGLIENILSTLNEPDAYLNKIAVTVVVAIIGLLIHIFFKNLMKTYISDIRKRLKVSKAFKIIMISLTSTAVLFIWIRAINALILIALLLGIFIIFMLRGLTHNIIGFFVIKYRRYFEVGHRVEIGDIIGDVIEINPVSFKLLEIRKWLSSDSNTGRFIEVPNSIIFDKSVQVVGLENKLIWHEINYTLSYESDWQEAERIMREAGDLYFKETVVPLLEEINENLPMTSKELRPIFSLDTTTTGIVVTLRYITNYREGTKSKTKLQRIILSKFGESSNIEFAPEYINIISS